MKIPELQGIEALKKNVVGVADLAVIRELVKLILGTRRAFFFFVACFLLQPGAVLFVKGPMDLHMALIEADKSDMRF
jgi:hypothetical protein